MKTKSRRSILSAVLLVAAAVPLSGLITTAAAADAKVQLMFVQSSESLRADDKTLRLVNVSPQTIYFTDRPVRMAGHITMPAYLKEWTTAAGPDNFSKDPPNATLSVYEAGDSANTLTVVEISHPVVEGKDIVYRYKLLEGKVPTQGGATSLFIDWIGPGGGVGAGFHGVGAGGRGVGVR
jgi:hypothetical protein